MSAYSFFQPFRHLIKGETVAIDNEVFRLHYRGTVAVLILFSALLSAKQFFGDPIQCHTRESSLQSLVTTYCWVHGTYTLKYKVEVPEREYNHKEKQWLQTYGERPNRRGGAHDGLGTFQASLQGLVM